MKTSPNDTPESIVTAVPGPKSAEIMSLLHHYESRNVTYIAEDFPVAWESGQGATITDRDGNNYIDLTAAFGVANVGHANPRILAAIAEQAQKLPHGLGDIHPNDVKALLLRRIAKTAPPGLTKTILATTGSEAVEAAMKTAILVTGKSAFASFRGAYHGLSLGTLAVTGIEKFRRPFDNAIATDTLFLNFPHATRERDAEERLHDALRDAANALDSRHDLAALIIEPIQGRGGIIVPPDGYLTGLRKLCDERGLLLIFDEIFTGFGRTGEWFACMRERVIPDILCVGKALGGGMPISAAIAKPQIMDVWPASTGEALHTSTFLGHPVACAAALATIDEIENESLVQRARQLGKYLEQCLRTLCHPESSANGAQSRDIRNLEIRGRGLMWGIQLRDAATAERIVTEALARGVLLLPAGTNGDVLSLTPPLVISEPELHRAIDILGECISR